jgi:hypothetical protein
VAKSDLTPVIVYLPKPLAEEIRALAGKNFDSTSAECRRLILQAWEARKQT